MLSTLMAVIRSSCGSNRSSTRRLRFSKPPPLVRELHPEPFPLPIVQI